MVRSAQTSLSFFFSNVVNISHNNSLCCANYKKVSGHRYDFGVRDQSQINMKSVLPLVNPSFNL